MGSRSAKKSKKMQKSDSDLDEYDDDMSFNEVTILSLILFFCYLFHLVFFFVLFCFVVNSDYG